MTTEKASTKRIYKVTTNNLPLSCPMPTMALWDAHPRVYLPIETTGKETCPYCGATFILETTTS
ncbi:MAG: zinc-finger domain-containing protein [Gammaproteobacteria bacterium]